MVTGNTGKMKHKYCEICLRNLKTDEEIESGICKWCKDDDSYGKKKYNYLTDSNPKDGWDNQAPYSDDYSDQYNW